MSKNNKVLFLSLKDFYVNDIVDSSYVNAIKNYNARKIFILENIIEIKLGLITESQVKSKIDKLIMFLKHKNVIIRDTFYCDGEKACMKPDPALSKMIIEKYNLNRDNIVSVGSNTGLVKLYNKTTDKFVGVIEPHAIKNIDRSKLNIKVDNSDIDKLFAKNSGITHLDKEIFIKHYS